MKSFITHGRRRARSPAILLPTRRHPRSHPWTDPKAFHCSSQATPKNPNHKPRKHPRHQCQVPTFQLCFHLQTAVDIYGCVAPEFNPLIPNKTLYKTGNKPVKNTVTMVRLSLPNRLKSYTNSAANSRSTSPNPASRTARNNGGGSDSSGESPKANGLMLKVNVIKVCDVSLRIVADRSIHRKGRC